MLIGWGVVRLWAEKSLVPGAIVAGVKSVANVAAFLFGPAHGRGGGGHACVLAGAWLEGSSTPRPLPSSPAPDPNSAVAVTGSFLALL